MIEIIFHKNKKDTIEKKLIIELEYSVFLT
nr:MAG TPA_asm: hypothetical protein [Caudoviricetes sp.]